MGKVVYYRNGKEPYVKITKTDRRISKKHGIKIGKSNTLSVDKYGKILMKIGRKKR